MSTRLSSRRLAGWLIIAAQAVYWAIPSHVVKLIALDRPTLLGRYSSEKVGAGLVMLLISIPILLILFAPAAKLKSRIFRVVAVLLVVLPGLFLVDVAGRLIRKPRYVADEGFYSRPPGFSTTVTWIDKPEAARTYPNVQPGYPPVVCDLNIDARGFRNPPGIDRCDILAIGDSFTEGSKVSDKQCWPARLADATGQVVYNLGMSGGNTQEYLLSYEKIGRPLKPRLVICMVYEGNDFRGTNIDRDRQDSSKATGWRSVEKYVKASPLIGPPRELLTRLLGPVNAHGGISGGEAIDWLPLGVPEESPRYYAFDPKTMLSHRVPAKAFAESRGWKNAATALKELARLCCDDSSRLVIAFAPSKPHVVLPLARHRLNAGQVRAFAALVSGKLPPADEFLGGLFERMDVMEAQTESFCRAEGIEFVSLTEPLRAQTAAGRQIYYSYDQHWTPEGHIVAAERLLDVAAGTSASATQPSE